VVPDVKFEDVPEIKINLAEAEEDLDEPSTADQTEKLASIPVADPKLTSTADPAVNLSSTADVPMDPPSKADEAVKQSSTAELAAELELPSTADPGVEQSSTADPAVMLPTTADSPADQTAGSPCAEVETPLVNSCPPTGPEAGNGANNLEGSSSSPLPRSQDSPESPRSTSLPALGTAAGIPCYRVF
jgi:hypothetical protein